MGEEIEKQVEENVLTMSILHKMASIRDEASFFRDDKIQTNQGSYDIWTEAGVLKVLRPLFKKYRVLPIREKIESVYADSKTIKIIVTMRMYDLDDLTQYFYFTGIGTGYDKVDKDAGKASTYATKDAYLKLFTAVSGLDSDKDGSDAQDAMTRAEAKGLLDQLWGKGHFSFKAAKEEGQDTSVAGWEKLVESKARKYYQLRATEIEEGKLADVANMIHTMQTILK